MEKLEDIVVRAQTGDAAAYDLIFQRFKDMALAYAYSILGDYELAEDARQEAFLDAYCDLLSLREPAAFPGWFRRIVQRHSIRLGKGRGALMAPLGEAPEIASPAPSPAKIAERREIGGQVMRAIGRLPARERQVTQLFYIEHRPLREIGELIGVPAKTVKSRLHSARARLRQRLIDMAKDTLRKRHLAGDKTATQAATAEAIAQFRAEAEALLKKPTLEDERRASGLLCAEGRLHRFLGQMDQSLACFEKGMTIPSLKGDPLHRARFRTEMGQTYAHLSDYARAEEEFRASRALVRGKKDRAARALLAPILNGLGLCRWGEGEFREARKYYAESVKVSRREKWAEWEAGGRNNLALLDWKAGRLEPALENFRVCLRRWEKIGNRFGGAVTLMNLAIIEENLGRYAKAQRHYEEAAAMAQEVGFRKVVADTKSNLANLALAQGRWSDALHCAAEGLDMSRAGGDRRSQAIALENLALAHIGLKQASNAWRALREARRIAKTIGDQERLFSLDLVEIEWLLDRGTLRGVAAKLERAGRTLRAKGYAAERPRLLRLRARAEIVRGDQESARGALAEARREAEGQKNGPEERRIRTLERLLQ